MFLSWIATNTYLKSLLRLCLCLLPTFVIAVYASENEQTFVSDEMTPLNVFKQPLALFSRQPVTGFHRDGYCRTSAGDFGNHAVAGIVTEEFLDFTASQGNDLRSIGGMQGGCKWCLCTSRWFEAYQAYKDGRIGKGAVPTVDLSATEDSALRKVDLDMFKEFAAKSESNGAS